MFAGDDVKEKKPDPSIYLTAAKVYIDLSFFITKSSSLKVLFYETLLLISEIRSAG